MRFIVNIFLFLLSMSATAADKLVVYTVNYPLQYFAQRIGGEHVSAHFPGPKDVDPAFWKPDVKTVVGYQHADLILLNGAGYAKWTSKVSLPRLRVIDTSRGFRDQYIHKSGKSSHSHGPGGEHSHVGTAFTTWIDFNQAIQQAERIKNALIRKRPELDEVFEQNFKKLKQDMQVLDDQLKGIALTNTRQPLVTSHPVYQYFARRYGLSMESLLWKPDEQPTEGQWSELQLLVKEHRAKWMIWEGKPLQSSIDKLQLMGIGSVVFDPCGNRPEQGDFLSVMRENTQRLKRIQLGQ